MGDKFICLILMFYLNVILKYLKLNLTLALITKKSSYFVTLIICSILTVTGYINLDFFFSLCLVLLVLMNVCQQILVTKTCSSKFYYLFELSFYIRPKLWNIFNLPTVYENINFAYYLKLCFKYFNFLSMF